VELLKRRRGGGQELLAYKSGARWSDVGSADINEYVKAATGGDFTAKDFRTWNATVLAAIALATADEASSRAARKRAIKEAIKGVSVFLGNTPAVARSSYIDPRVFDRYLSGWTISGPLARKGQSSNGLPSSRRSIEKAVIDLIAERR
jgi:DNA topoisomerase I